MPDAVDGDAERSGGPAGPSSEELPVLQRVTRSISSRVDKLVIKMPSKPAKQVMSSKLLSAETEPRRYLTRTRVKSDSHKSAASKEKKPRTEEPPKPEPSEPPKPGPSEPPKPGPSEPPKPRPAQQSKIKPDSPTIKDSFHSYIQGSQPSPDDDFLVHIEPDLLYTEEVYSQQDEDQQLMTDKDLIHTLGRFVDIKDLKRMLSNTVTSSTQVLQLFLGPQPQLVLKDLAAEPPQLDNDEESLSKQLDQLKEEINTQQLAISDYRKTIEDQDKKLEETSQTIAEQSHKIEDQSKTIVDQNQKVDEQGQQIQNQEHSIIELNQQIDQLKSAKTHAVEEWSSQEASMQFKIQTLSNQNSKLRSKSTKYLADWQRAQADRRTAAAEHQREKLELEDQLSRKTSECDQLRTQRSCDQELVAIGMATLELHRRKKREQHATRNRQLQHLHVKRLVMSHTSRYPQSGSSQARRLSTSSPILPSSASSLASNMSLSNDLSSPSSPALLPSVVVESLPLAGNEDQEDENNDDQEGPYRQVRPPPSDSDVSSIEHHIV